MLYILCKNFIIGIEVKLIFYPFLNNASKFIYWPLSNLDNSQKEIFCMAFFKINEPHYLYSGICIISNTVAPFASNPLVSLPLLTIK